MDFKDRLCGIIEKFVRYSYTTGENLNMVVHESDYFDELENASIITIDYSWLIARLDNYLIIADDTKSYSNYILAEELISVSINYSWNDDSVELESLYDWFEYQVNRSCSNLGLSAYISKTFTYDIFKSLIMLLHNSSQLDYMLVLGWVGKKMPILAVMEI